MKKYNIKIAILCLICMFSISISCFAYDVTTVGPEKYTYSNNIVTVPISIKDNSGIMGFKISLDYNPNEIEILNIQKGQITQKGSFSHNLGVKAKGVDILWNNVEENQQNGTLFTLKLKCLTNEPISISITYSQEDTFNEKMDDVVLECLPISLNENETTNGTATENKSDETITSAVEENTNSDNLMSEFSEKDIEDVITETLYELHYKSITDVPKDRQTFILDSVNLKLYKRFGLQSYFSSFDHLSFFYKVTLKEELKHDIEQSIEENSKQDVLNDYSKTPIEQRKSVQDYIENIQESNLEEKFQDNLSKNDLEDVLNNVLTSQEKNKNAKLQLKKDVIVSVIIVVLVLATILVVLNIYRKKKAKKDLYDKS